MLKCISIILLLFLTTQIFCVNRNNSTLPIFNLDKTYYNFSYLEEALQFNNRECEGKLFINELNITNEDINLICNTLIKHPMFLIRIQNYSETLISNSVILEASSLKFFNDECVNFPLMCRDGILIELFTEERVILIQPGKQAKKIVSEKYRDRVVQTARNNLIKEEWGISLDKVVRLLDYKMKGGMTKLNQGKSNELKIFIYYTLIPILISIFISLFLFMFLMSKGFMNRGLFHFMDRMIYYWEKINDSPDKKIKLPVDTCLLCMRQGKSTYKFLYCNHSYHYRCLYKWQMDIEKCCPCSYVAVQGEESAKIDLTKPAYLNCEDIKLILGYILDAHRKQNVYDYFIENEDKIRRINEEYNISFEEICWIYTNKLAIYKNYRIFYKMWRTLKMMCCILTFYPSDLTESNKGRLVRRLMNVRAQGATVREFK